ARPPDRGRPAARAAPRARGLAQGRGRAQHRDRVEGALPMKSQLEDLTYAELRERLADDPVILVPLGSQEEQGASAPMGDFMLAKELARRVAEKTGAIAAPTVPFGYADYFRPVAGGVQLTAE